MKQKTFIDSARIKIKGGRGGDGSKAFHREKFVERGGPSGGTGGNGGSIFFIADLNINTLLDFKGHSLFRGDPGGNGANNNKSGFKGKDLYIKIPVGTEIFVNDKKTADLSFHHQLYLVATGGKGGRGNASFKSSKNTAPTMFEHGEEPEWLEINMELKVLADIGLLGYPNVGKSTLISVISNAKPKIADYEFTTLIPKLGTIKHNGTHFVITDLPGLIDGAAENKGMGHQFLKHLSRTKIIFHLLDGTKSTILQNYKNLRLELKKYSEELVKLPEIIVITKIDLLSSKEQEQIKEIFKNQKIFFISSIIKKGIKDLLDFTATEINILREKETNKILELEKESDSVIIELPEENDPLKINYQDGIWYLQNKYTKYWANRIPLSTSENMWRIVNKLKSKGYIKTLEKKGIKNGEQIVIVDSPFTLVYRND